MQNTRTQYRLVSICGRNCMCRLGVVIEFAKDTEYKDPIQTSVDLRQKLHVSTQGCHRICKRCKIHAPNTDQCRFAAETACVDLGLSQNLQKIRNTRTQYRLVSICGRNCMCRLRVVIEFAKDVKYTHPIQTSVDLRQKLHVSTQGCHRICKRYGIQGPNTDQCRFAAETACVDLGLSQNLQKMQNTRTQYRLVSICGRNCMCRLRVVIEFAKDAEYKAPNTDQCRFAAETACVDFCAPNTDQCDLRQKLSQNLQKMQNTSSQYRLVSICGRNCMCRLGVVIEFAKDAEYKDPIQTSVDLRQKLHVSTQGCHRICKRYGIQAPNTDQCRFAAETACVDLGLSQNLQKMQNTRTQYRLVSICGRNCMCRLRVVIEFAKDAEYKLPIQTSVDLRQKLHVSTWGCHRICKRYGIQGPNTDQCRFAAETACVDLGLSQNLQKMQNTSSQYRLVSICGRNCMCRLRVVIEFAKDAEYKLPIQTSVDLRQKLHVSIEFARNTRTQYRLVSICGRNCMCRLRVVIEFAKDAEYTHPIQTSVDLRQKLHVSTQGCHRICKRCRIQAPNTDQCRFAAETACVDLGLSQNLQKIRNTRTQYRLVSICGRNCMCRLRVVIECGMQKMRQKLHVSTQGCRRICKRCKIHAPNTDQCRFAAETACVDLGLSQNLQKMQNTSTQYRLVSICGRNCMCRLRVVIEFAKDTEYTHPIQTSVDLRQKLHVSTQGCHRICKRCRIQAPNTDQCRFAAETACVDLGLSQNLQKIRNTRTQYRLVSICGRNCMCRLRVVIEFAKDAEYTHPIQTSVDLRQKLHVSTQGCHRICKRCRIQAPNTDQCRFAAETACVDLGLSQNLQKIRNTRTQYRLVSICGRNCMCRLRVVVEFAKDVKYTHPIQTSVDLRQKLHVSTQGCHRICKRCRIHAPNTDQCRFAAETACVDLGLSQNLQKMQNTSSQYRLVSICGRNCMCRLGVVIEFAKDTEYKDPIQTSVDLRQKLHVSTQGCRRICKRCKIHAPNTDQCRFAAETACVDLGLSQNLQKMQNTSSQYRLVSICGRNCMCRLRVVIEFAKDEYKLPIQSVDLRQKLHVSTQGCHRICKRWNTRTQYRLVSICGRNCMCRLRVVIEFAKDVKYTHPIQTSVDLRQKLHVSTQGCHRICKRCRIQAPNTDQCRFAAETACVDLGLSQNLQKMQNTSSQYRLVSICGRNCMCRLGVVIEFAKDTEYKDPIQTSVDLRQKLHVSTQGCRRICKRCKIHAPNTDQCRFAAETACVDLGLSQNLQKMQNTRTQYRLVSICGRNCMCRLRVVIEFAKDAEYKLPIQTKCRFAAETACVDLGLSQNLQKIRNTRTQYRLVSICGRNCMCRLRVVIEFAKDAEYKLPIQTKCRFAQGWQNTNPIQTVSCGRN